MMIHLPNRELKLGREHFYPFGAVLLAVAMGMCIARFTLFAFGGVVVAIVVLAGIAVIRKKNLLAFALAACGVLIAFPAFLPRPSADRASAAYGGNVDGRGVMQLIVIVAVVAMGLWLWLVSDAGIRPLFHSSPMLTLLVYSLLILVSLLYAPDTAWSLFGLLKLLAIVVLLVVLTVTVKTPAQLKRVLDAMVAAVTVLLVIYWLDIVRGAASIYEGRPEVSWLNPNSATLAAVVLTMIMTARYLATRSMHRPLTTIGVGLFGAITALSAGSKSSLGAGAIALAVVVAAVLWRSPTGFRLARLLIMLVGVIAIMGYFVATDSGIVAHLQAYESNQNVDPTNLTGRVPVWTMAVSETLASPFTTLMGHGYLSTFALGIKGHYWVAYQAHNSFVQTFFDLGILGLGVVVFLYAQTWFRIVRASATLPVGDPRWSLALELLAAFTVLTIVSGTEDIMGGVVETRSFVFFIVVFCINQNMAFSPSPTAPQQISAGRSSTGGHNRRISPSQDVTGSVHRLSQR